LFEAVAWFGRQSRLSLSLSLFLSLTIDLLSVVYLCMYQIAVVLRPLAMSDVCLCMREDRARRVNPQRFGHPTLNIRDHFSACYIVRVQTDSYLVASGGASTSRLRCQNSSLGWPAKATLSLSLSLELTCCHFKQALFFCRPDSATSYPSGSVADVLPAGQ